MKKSLTIWLVAGLAFACQNEDIRVKEEEEKIYQFVLGSWLYTEYGYSPGAGYYTVQVPADPPQTVTFKGNLTMSSTVEHFEKYRHYRLLQDTVLDHQVIAFFEKNPGNEPLDLADLTTTYVVFWEDNDLKLGYRWCIEGCHQKFKRLSLPEPG